MLNRKFNTLTVILALIVVLSAVLLTSCTADSKKDEAPSTINNGGNTTAGTTENTTVASGNNASGTTAATTEAGVSGTILTEFEKLTSTEKNPAKIRAFIDANVGKADEVTATSMVLKLEDAQNEYYEQFSNRFVGIEIEKKLSELYKDGLKDIKPEDIKDAEVKALLAEVSSCGYSMDTSEGMYYPILDYSIYEGYSSKLTPDIAVYFEIMAVESNEVPAKDAAIVIGWDQVVERSLKQEAFLLKYPDSKRKEAVNKLYQKYLSFTYLGANNTPLFEIDTKIMNKDAKEAYMKAISSAGASGAASDGYIGKLDAFMKLSEKSGYKLTYAVDKYRSNIIKQ